MRLPARYAATMGIVASALIAAAPAAAQITVTDDPVLYWNEVMLGALPPSVAVRGYAMMNIAMHDAVNATLGGPNNPYSGGIATMGGNSRAAASQAARDVLVNLAPGLTMQFDTALASSLALVPDGAAKTNGIATGSAYAGAIITDRTGDGAFAASTYMPSGLVGRWAPTPTAFAPAATQQWGGVDPFLIASGSQFRPGPPPALTSAEWAAAYNEVRMIGAAGSMTRTADQTASATFWNPSNGATWVRFALDIAADEGLSTLENAELFAMIGAGTADTLITGWNTKTFYDFWRPVTAIRAGETDGNAATIGDPGWTPLNSAPPHQSYLSTLSAISGMTTSILADYLDDEAFCLTFGGNNRCWTGFEDAATDAANSRLWGGIHYRFDSEAGLTAGRQIGRVVLNSRAFNAVPEPATWTMMIAGFGLAGRSLRRGRIRAVAS